MEGRHGRRRVVGWLTMRGLWPAATATRNHGIAISGEEGLMDRRASACCYVSREMRNASGVGCQRGQDERAAVDLPDGAGSRVGGVLNARCPPSRSWRTTGRASCCDRRAADGDGEPRGIGPHGPPALSRSLGKPDPIAQGAQDADGDAPATPTTTTIRSRIVTRTR